MGNYKVSFYHKISNPNGASPGRDVSLKDGCFSDKKTLGKALRESGTIPAGTVIDSFRVEGNRVIAFPRGLIWHSIILDHIA